MNKNSWVVNLISLLIVTTVIVIGFMYVKSYVFNKIGIAHPHDDAPAAEGFNRGPHRGRLLEKDGFQVEVSIFEPEGVPPKFRIYFYENNTPIDPSKVTFDMVLKRINRVEKIPFKQEMDYLQSTVEASEPHSFKVDISASFKDKSYHWDYDSFEGRVELSPEAITANEIKIDKAGPLNMEIKLDAMGKIMANEELTVFISPRFPGVVKAVNKKLGDLVRKGDVLATIESNESLQNYEIRSEINGMVIKKDINLGMYLSGQESIFVISDLSTVWADFNIYRQDLSQVKVGDPIGITSLDGSLKEQSTISYISPVGNENTQSVIARSFLSNSNGQWKPGLFISGEITVDNVLVEIAVKDEALQTFRDWDVVFLSEENLFEVAPVELGRRNKEWVEIKSGLKSGDSYVSDNSFILKADLEKSGAKHEH
ncbi:MAG TPA: efflux RND transporter periplasmic adaptor subunit [Parachlamydiaceae bacterium]|nr:efflux RND transporter periplasmic adaptor subunit [Parachlamydiaceae bacterium]